MTAGWSAACRWRAALQQPAYVLQELYEKHKRPERNNQEERRNGKMKNGGMFISMHQLHPPEHVHPRDSTEDRKAYGVSPELEEPLATFRQEQNEKVHGDVFLGGLGVADEQEDGSSHHGLCELVTTHDRRVEEVAADHVADGQQHHAEENNPPGLAEKGSNASERLD